MLKSQLETGYAAVGRPQPSGFGESEGKSEGIEPREKNQIKIPDEFQLSA